MASNTYDAIINDEERARLKPPAQCMEALRAVLATNARESASADFHELRQDFSPTDKMQKEKL